MTELGQLEDPSGNFPLDDPSMDLMELVEEEALRPRDRVELIKDLIEEAEIMPIEAGSIWYLVSTRWMSGWSRWAMHASEDDDQFGPVDNSDLVDEDNLHMSPDLIAIKENLRDERDYLIIPESAWTLLSSWSINKKHSIYLIVVGMVLKGFLSRGLLMSMPVERRGSRLTWPESGSPTSHSPSTTPSKSPTQATSPT